MQHDLTHAGAFWSFHLGMSKTIWVKSSTQNVITHLTHKTSY